MPKPTSPGRHNLDATVRITSALRRDLDALRADTTAEMSELRASIRKLEDALAQLTR